MKKVIIVRGLPGSGKTTLARMLTNCDNGFAIAADDYPGIYNEDGIYQAQHQKASHDWCLQQFKGAIARGNDPVIVHNTFANLGFLAPYIESAKKAGYSVQIVHSEKVILPSGNITESIHGVPKAISESMLAGWQPATPKPDYVTRKEVAIAFHKILSLPHHVPTLLVDMDGTIKQTKSGTTFPQSPDDAVLNPDFIDGVRSLKLINRDLSITVISNQAGINGGQKTLEFLNDEIRYLDRLLNLEVIMVDGYKCAVSKTGSSYVSYVFEQPDEMEFVSCTSAHPTYKPAIGLASTVVELTDNKLFWVIGDSDANDGLLAKNLQARYPDRTFIYVPIEFFAIAARMHYQNY